MTHLQPKVRQALLAMAAARGRALTRTRGGYAAVPAQITRSGTVPMQVFTRRAVNWLDEAGFVDFDDPSFPTRVTLNSRGQAAAQSLLAQAKAMASTKAVRA